MVEDLFELGDWQLIKFLITQRISLKFAGLNSETDFKCSHSSMCLLSTLHKCVGQRCLCTKCVSVLYDLKRYVFKLRDFLFFN